MMRRWWRVVLVEVLEPLSQGVEIVGFAVVMVAAVGVLTWGLHEVIGLWGLVAVVVVMVTWAAGRLASYPWG